MTHVSNLMMICIWLRKSSIGNGASIAVADGFIPSYLQWSLTFWRPRHKALVSFRPSSNNILKLCTNLSSQTFRGNHDGMVSNKAKYQSKVPKQLMVSLKRPHDDDDDDGGGSEWCDKLSQRPFHFFFISNTQ